MERLKGIGLTEIEYNGVRRLIVEGKVKVETFLLFSDEELAATLRELSALQQSSGKFLSLFAALKVIAHILFTMSIVIDDLFAVVFAFLLYLRDIEVSTFQIFLTTIYF
jgi:hypothetical protein